MILIKVLQRRVTMLAFTCMLSMMHLYAQKDYAIKAIANVKQDTIALRWAPTDKEVWKIANQYGYGIIRYTLATNNVLLQKPYKEFLTLEALKPIPLLDWTSIALNNPYGALVAQALYGTDFKVEASTHPGPSWQQAYQKSNEQDMRFSFALFAADMDKDIAKASGLYWVDTTVKKGSRYLYKIYVETPALTHPNPYKPRSKSIDTALVYVNTDTYTYLPKPAAFRADFMDSTAVLSWNRQAQHSVYVAYQIERSTDGGTSFQVRNQRPFVPVLKDSNPFAFYIDSTLTNVQHHYRILGINAFGQKGPYSDIVKGISKPSAQQAPKYLRYELQNHKAIKLSWQYDVGQYAHIKGFKVYRSLEHENGYKVLNNNELINKNHTHFIDLNPLPASYYKVIAVDLLGNEHNSIPVLVQFEDKNPPKAPTALAGSIDKKGQVQLTWLNNTEDDLLGYYVYASNGRHEEYVRISPSNLKASKFITHVELKTLTDSIYYEVSALDKHYNESQRTLLAMPRPDIVPPAPVGIISTEGCVEGIKLLWYNSPSKDTKWYLITRIEEDCKSCEKQTRILHQGDSSFYLDSTALVGKTYQYSIQAEDKNELHSEKMETIKVQRKRKQHTSKVYAFVAAWDKQSKSIKLDWKASGSTTRHWIIYRASQGEKLAQYASSQHESFTDTEVEPLKTYEYYLRPVFIDRTMGHISNAVIVKPESN